MLLQPLYIPFEVMIYLPSNDIRCKVPHLALRFSSNQLFEKGKLFNLTCDLMPRNNGLSVWYRSLGNE